MLSIIMTKSRLRDILRGSQGIFCSLKTRPLSRLRDIRCGRQGYAPVFPLRHGDTPKPSREKPLRAGLSAALRSRFPRGSPSAGPAIVAHRRRGRCVAPRPRRGVPTSRLRDIRCGRQGNGLLSIIMIKSRLRDICCGHQGCAPVFPLRHGDTPRRTREKPLRAGLSAASRGRFSRGSPSAGSDIVAYRSLRGDGRPGGIASGGAFPPTIPPSPSACAIRRRGTDVPAP